MSRSANKNIPSSSSTPQSHQPPSQPRTESQTGAIVGGVIGGCITLSLWALLVLLYRRRRMRCAEPANGPMIASHIAVEPTADETRWIASEMECQDAQGGKNESHPRSQLVTALPALPTRREPHSSSQNEPSAGISHTPNELDERTQGSGGHLDAHLTEGNSRPTTEELVRLINRRLRGEASGNNEDLPPPIYDFTSIR